MPRFIFEFETGPIKRCWDASNGNSLFWPEPSKPLTKLALRKDEVAANVEAAHCICFFSSEGEECCQTPPFSWSSVNKVVVKKEDTGISLQVTCGGKMMIDIENRETVDSIASIFFKHGFHVVRVFLLLFECARALASCGIGLHWFLAEIHVFSHFTLPLYCFLLTASLRQPRLAPA